MSKRRMITLDGNEAVARVAYLGSEVIAIYPITPSSNMAEWCDEWASQSRLNLWGVTPTVIEMQSEGGVAGALHGALQAGALATSFTASQGLLLMIPNMYKIAGELTSFVLHVSARTIATHALSIFGDHSDVMACRPTGFSILAAGSVQEAQDMALIAQTTSLEGRIPVLHFFDGFRTSHEVAKIEALDADTVRAMISEDRVIEHRKRAMSPEHPVLRGSSQNPDVFFQARERINPYYSVFPKRVQGAMNRFAQLTGRAYRLFDYVGAPDAERVIVLMGSGAEIVHETVDDLVSQGERVGVVKVRLYRPFDASALVSALPVTVGSIAVLDRCKEPGADGEPLYKDVVTALAQAAVDNLRNLPRVIGGRYGLSSKEFTPGMVKAVFNELSQPLPKRDFTVGIVDDVTHLSLDWDRSFRTEASKNVQQAVFYGLGSDGTVSANKNSIKIIGESTELYAQGYFVYDSKKSGAVTVSHLRFGPQPIRSAYLIGDDEAQFVACHQTVFMERYDMLAHAAPGAVFLLNTAVSPDRVWNSLSEGIRKQILDKGLRFYVIDAYRVAEAVGMGRRINTIMQTCFFAIAGVLPREDAIKAIKAAVDKTYGRKSKRLAELNYQAIDQSLENLHQIALGGAVEATTGELSRPAPPLATLGVPDFVRNVTVPIFAGRGDSLPVSLMPVDGTFPVGTAAWEKRNIALEIPVWDERLCTQCGKCVFVCPHSAIRSRVFPEAAVTSAPSGFKHVPVRSKDYPPGTHISYQVAAEDCTGCGLCVEACPIHDKSDVGHRAVNMAPQPALREQERENLSFFLGLPEYDRDKIKHVTIPGAMLLDPLFEFSGACSGCGETPYIRLASQLFGDRMMVANATGCSSIYGGNLPTTPWTKNAEGRGPAWNNSLFEDNAEFGLGMRVAVDQLRGYACDLLKNLAGRIGGNLVDALLAADQAEERGIRDQRQRVAELLGTLAQLNSRESRDLAAVAEYLIRRSVWIIGGDGWAYDIGYGGLDHVLAQSYDVNVLVLDTEVYSNTGGQTSKATPLGAVAKFSSGGKPTAKKDLAKLAMDYGHVYVAQVAFGAKDVHTLRVFHEAESYRGPSLIIAYSPCIAHGVDLQHNLRQQELAVKTGYFPLFRYDPREAKPFRVDSPEPSLPLREFTATETRFAMLFRSHPEAAQQFLDAAQQGVKRHYADLQFMAAAAAGNSEQKDS
ncbi:MAG: pyruvate:ferredoxin (flavodoxin) oxidoreductase [Thiobacillaceae bacterium]